MSLANIKAKESKGKTNVLPKLKTILANPKKTKCPSLTTDQLEEFRSLICNAINNSGQDPRAYATSVHIRLGLSSCLRAINNCQSSCVFLSLSTRPQYLINLIARNMEVKDETVPVFVQPQLEQFIFEVFGIKALTMVLPAETAKLGEELDGWITARKRPKIVKNAALCTPLNSKNKHKRKAKKQEDKIQTSSEKAVEPVKPAQEKSWSSDFISFSNSANDRVDLDKLHINDDKNLLLGALSKMSAQVEEATISECLEMADTEGESAKNPAREAVSSDTDDFLEECDYHPLTVLKVSRNPNKKVKKRKKAQKK